MWCKIKQLKETERYSNSKIARILGIHRDTVRMYLKMSEIEFTQWLEKSHYRVKKLDKYQSKVKELLEQDATLSASAIEDRLKESDENFPKISSKTVYNFVEFIRKRYTLPKKTPHLPRQYEKISESGYGQYAQVDFGETYMSTSTGTRVKIYFFAMVLCRSRAKFIYLQRQPFTSRSSIYAHNEAFLYFKGQPHNIIYDQDKVFLKSENFGDLLLTQEFGNYTKQMDFKKIFCRKADPESKGKVENVVKYVKENFLRGRIFKTETQLNEEAMGWLARTGNGKEHAGTHKIPYQEWQIEQSYLIPLQPHQIVKEVEESCLYTVRKDNTISYKSNFYSLPLNTYIGVGTQVKVKEELGKLLIYNIDNELIASHIINQLRGQYVYNNNHRRDYSSQIDTLEKEVLEMYPQDEKFEFLIKSIRTDKPRYYRDNLLIIKKEIQNYSNEIKSEAVNFCLENRIYNGGKLMEIMKKKAFEKVKKDEIMLSEININIHVKNVLFNQDLTPKVSKISVYEKLFEI